LNCRAAFAAEKAAGSGARNCRDCASSTVDKDQGFPPLRR
jgi:hypothetical protein